MKKFNIALTFEKEVADSITSYAKELCKNMDSDVLLGTNSNPHMTIGQFSVEDSVAKQVWEKYKSSSIELPKINLAGITILPSSSGGAWIEVSVLKSEALLKLQNDLIKVLKPFGVLTNDTGDNYRPHITVAHTITGSEFSNFPFEYKTLRLKSVITSLGIGLGTNFENFTF
jgi:2'-5' RNA ligase